MWNFLIGFFVGGVSGFVAMALCAAAGNDPANRINDINNINDINTEVNKQDE